MATEDRRVEKTKKIIDDACLALMEEKNFDEITVRDIAERAKINRATFYRYHADKYDWLEKKIRQMVRELLQISGKLHETQDPQLFSAAFEAVFRHFDANFSAYAVLMRNQGTAMFQNMFKSLLLDLNYRRCGMQPGQDPQLDLRYQFAVSAVVGAIEWWVKNDRPLSGKQMAEAFCGLYGRWTGKEAL